VIADGKSIISEKYLLLLAFFNRLLDNSQIRQLVKCQVAD